MSGLRVPVVGPSCHVRHAPHPHNAASFSQRTCIRRFRQNADPFSQNSPISPFFTQLVCTLAAKLRQVAAVPSPIGGNCTTRGCDTPATRRKRASCSAKPPTLTPAVTPTPEPMPSVTHSFGHADPVDTLDAELVHSPAYAIHAFDSRASSSQAEAAGSHRCRHGWRPR